jgi:hypothetical protein
VHGVQDGAEKHEDDQLKAEAHINIRCADIVPEG